MRLMAMVGLKRNDQPAPEPNVRSASQKEYDHVSQVTLALVAAASSARWRWLDRRFAKPWGGGGVVDGVAIIITTATVSASASSAATSAAATDRR